MTRKKNSLWLWWYHWSTRWMGHRTLDNYGNAMIPCRRCGVSFKSYTHYGEWGYVYDDTCKRCIKEKIK